jgi:hypothetical protein
MSTETDHVRATRALLDRFPHPRAWPGRKEVCALRRKRGLRGSLEREYAYLKEGKPVRRIFAEAVMILIDPQKRGWPELTFDAAFELAAVTIQDPYPRDSSSILDFIRSKFEDHDAMCCHNPVRDSLQAAEMIARCVGHMDENATIPESPASRLQRGIEKMAWPSLDEYAGWLMGMLRKDYRTVMFAVARHKKEWVRIAAVVVLPLTESAFNRFCAGEISERELTPDDLQPRSKYLLIHAMSDECVPGISDSQRSRAQAHCVMYQCAYFTRLLKPLHPVAVTIKTNPQYADRLHRHGYREIGVCMRGSDYPIMVLRHPSESTTESRRSKSLWDALDELISYRLMRDGLKLYRVANKQIWAEEDRIDPRFANSR